MTTLPKNYLSRFMAALEQVHKEYDGVDSQTAYRLARKKMDEEEGNLFQGLTDAKKDVP